MLSNKELYCFEIAVMSLLVQDVTIAAVSTNSNPIFSPLSLTGRL